MVELAYVGLEVVEWLGVPLHFTSFSVVGVQWVLPSLYLPLVVCQVLGGVLLDNFRYVLRTDPFSAMASRIDPFSAMASKICSEEFSWRLQSIVDPEDVAWRS